MIDKKEEQEEMWNTFDELIVEREAVCLNDEVDNFIIDKIKDALIDVNWNQAKASEKLGLKRTTFISKCNKYNLLHK